MRGKRVRGRGGVRSLNAIGQWRVHKRGTLTSAVLPARPFGAVVAVVDPAGAAGVVAFVFAVIAIVVGE